MHGARAVLSIIRAATMNCLTEIEQRQERAQNRRIFPMLVDLGVVSLSLARPGNITAAAAAMLAGLTISQL
jgi:hypothetical protein